MLSRVRKTIVCNQNWISLCASFEEIVKHIYTTHTHKHTDRLLCHTHLDCTFSYSRPVIMNLVPSVWQAHSAPLWGFLKGTSPKSWGVSFENCLMALQKETSCLWWGESLLLCLFNINSAVTISIKGHWASLSALRHWGLVSLEFSLSRLWKYFLLKNVRGIQLSCCHKGHCIKKPYLCWVTFHCTGRLANSLWTPRPALWWEWLMWSIESKSGIQGAKSKTIQANGNLFWAISIEALSGWLDGMNACWGQTRLSV